ncbi:hypothetical protein BH09ACT2_BH09ACT2_13330 [soil metagenome]
MPRNSPPLDSANDSPLTPLRFLKRSAEVFPDKTAIVYGARVYTYAEFAAAAEALARAIRSRIIPGDRVVFLSPNTPEMLIAQFAVPLAGGILISLNPRLSPSEVRYVIEHSGASLLFYDAEFASAIGDSREQCSTLRAIVEIPDPEFGCAESGVSIGQESYRAFGSATAANKTPVRWEIDDERAVISINYTSGTTGKPKGVMYSHRGAYLNAMGEVFHNGLDNQSVYLWTLPLFHCNGWCTPWAVTAASGTHVCLRAVRPASIWSAIDELGVTNLCGAPTVCNVIANAEEAHPLEHPLRITTAGAPPSPTIIERLERLGARVTHVYGLTEAYGPFTICEYQQSWDSLPPDRPPGSLDGAGGDPARGGRGDGGCAQRRQHHRGDRVAWQQRNGRLLQGRRSHRRGLRRRMVSHRRPGSDASRRVYRGQGPRKRHHHLRG